VNQTDKEYFNKSQSWKSTFNFILWKKHFQQGCLRTSWRFCLPSFSWSAFQGFGGKTTPP